MRATIKTGILIVVLVAVAIGASYLKRSEIYLLTLYCVYLMATFGLNLTVGYAGQMSLGQAAFFGIGAYTAAILMTKLGVSFWAVLPLAAVSCFVIGLALGFPALRVQHHYLAFATLVSTCSSFSGCATRRRSPVARSASPAFLGRRFWALLRHREALLLFHAGVVGLAGAFPMVAAALSLGRAFAALRDNPIRAESLGVNITAYTLLAFAIGAACAGIGGVYFASLVEFIEPGPFHFSTSLMMLLAVIVGGSGRFFGPVVGTIIIILLPEVLRGSNIDALKFMQKWYLVFFGVAIVALMIWLPEGILSIPDRFKRAKAVK
jgi:branched-chain amino acid transport system permease protein